MTVERFPRRDLLHDHEQEVFCPPNFNPLQAALFEASLALLALLLGWMFSRSPLETLQLQPHAIALGILAVLPLLGLLWVCGHRAVEADPGGASRAGRLDRAHVQELSFGRS